MVASTSGATISQLQWEGRTDRNYLKKNSNESVPANHNREQGANYQPKEMQAKLTAYEI